MKRVALSTIAGLHLGALAFTESFRELPAVAAAYTAAWWIIWMGSRDDVDIA
jgi:hypothetical protein